MAPEQQLHDVAIEREQRRSRQGYATPAEARAFLQMARQPQQTINPIATAYFRATEEPEAEGAPHCDVTDLSAPAFAKASAGQAREQDILTSIDAVVELLAEAGVMPERPRALLQASDEDSRATRLRQGYGGQAKLTLLKRLMEFVLHHDETAYLTRSRELAFVANTLLAGSSVQSRPFTAREASDAAACICNLGLECGPAPANAFLVDHDLVTTFEAGWSMLYRDVSLFVADQLVSTLADLDCVDADIRRDLRALRLKLEKHRKAGTPWLARDAAEVLAMLDMPAWISVLGLLDECPILPAALTAVLEHRATLVSPTAFEFISTTAQIGDIRLFMKALPGVLSR
jgi:hypothetical protein